MSTLPFYLIVLVPFSVVLGYSLGGAYTFLTPVFVFGVIPVLDLALGMNTSNPDAEQEEALKERFSYRIITMLCAPLQVGIVLWGVWVISRGTLTPLEAAGFIFSLGVSSGVMGINVSHELQHRVNRSLEPFLSRVMLWTTLYMHWAIEHVAGHHRSVATPEDPATARLGENFYTFWFRSVFGGMKSAWGIEASRLRRKDFRVFSVHNRLLWYGLAQVMLIAGLYVVFGMHAAVSFVIQAFIAFSLLEIVNYVEHYGLLRSTMPDGRYEPVTFVHSWNSSNWLSNRFLFNLQRHSDHHYKPERRYQLLRHFDGSPQLPTGYAGMILLAAVPPLWRMVMDRRVHAYRMAEKRA
ncbi:MAG: alkane 1-monooxygenase [Desulfobacterota bacterium]|jgi:alkane 1-monooxygenase|nr:alkane 1-monooxygenase [Thermodesulfobacteriota bacterium]